MTDTAALTAPPSTNRSTNEWIVERLRRGLAVRIDLPSVELACCALEAWPWAGSRRTARMLEIATGRWVDPETVARLRRLGGEDPGTFRGVRDGEISAGIALGDRDR